MPTEIQIEKNPRTVVTRMKDPKERWDDDDTYTDWDLGNTAWKINDNTPRDLITDLDLENNKIYYVPYAIWSTGNSFGRSENGKLEFIDIFSDYKLAQKVLDQLKEESKNNESLACATLETETGNKWDYLIPWLGFFEELTELDILEVIVEDET